MIRSVLPTHLSDFAGLSTSKSLKSARAKIGAWRGNTFAHCCAGWLANCADTNNRQRAPLSPDNSQPLLLAPQKGMPRHKVERRAGARVSSLAIAGAGVCSPADKRYLIHQTNATARGRSITIMIRGSALGFLGTGGAGYEITHREALSRACWA
jgi:hypothetical protein